MSELVSVTLSVNGASHTVEVDPSAPLVYVLRNRLGLTGAKIGCALEQCGSCAILVDGVSTLCCVAPVVQFEGRDIVTAEGLADHATGAAVQRAFVEAGAAQCGYCTPGMVVALTALLLAERHPDEARIRAALEPHLCRCGSHVRVLAAARRLAGGGDSP